MAKLSRKQLAELEAELHQLEAKDPTVAAAAKKLDDFMVKARAEFRRRAYELVESVCKERRITVLRIGEHVCTAVRHNEDSTERGPMPTLLGAVDLLGKP
ncbi:MAG TPA: hypothetical protein VK524_09410 [Polyangiaceae bacterium]|nr:hypothetical protein [Polyangiaceae bacterium]